MNAFGIARMLTAKWSAVRACSISNFSQWIYGLLLITEHLGQRQNLPIYVVVVVLTNGKYRTTARVKIKYDRCWPMHGYYALSWYRNLTDRLNNITRFPNQRSSQHKLWSCHAIALRLDLQLTKVNTKSKNIAVNNSPHSVVTFCHIGKACLHPYLYWTQR